MARKKEPPKPMFDLRHDFVASLENLYQQALMLMQTVDMVVKHETTPEPIKKILREQSAALRAALMSED